MVRCIGIGWVILLAASVPAAEPSGLAAKPSGPVSTTPSTSHQWPSFRGGAAQGVAAVGTLPDSWTDSDYRWSMSLQGVDVGSPVIANVTIDSEPYVFLTDRGEDDQSIRLLAIGLHTGTLKWEQSFPLQDRHRHQRNSPASTTPAVDDSHVYIAHGDAGGAMIRAYSHSGEAVWSRDLGPWTGYHGFGGSPVVVGNRVILFNSQQADKLEPDQTAGSSSMMAFDSSSGETVWSTPLTTTRSCYGVPAVDGDSAEKHLLAANTGDGMFSIDAATGAKRWSLKVFDKRCCSSPVVMRGTPHGDLVVASCGSGGGGNVLSAVRIPRTPDESPQEVFRITSNAPYVPTPCTREGLLFTVSDNGIASCWDSSGNKVWAQRLGGNFGASPIIVGDRLLAISLRGEATVMSATRNRSVGKSFSIGESVGASPAIADGCLLIRVDDRLVCLSI